MLKTEKPKTTRQTGATESVVTFENPAAYARSIRATAMVFEDPRSQDIQERVRRLAQSDATVLIVGETGTGKELIAHQLHRLSPRAVGPFIAVNCAALPEHLVESELFGHEKGAFTGAVGQKRGWFEEAHGGTLFLDEVGDLPLATQVKILRVIQEREINRVGSRTGIAIDVRFVAATNVNLEEAVRAGRFREDLYFRLNVARVDLPPLRERKGDVLPLVNYFIDLYRHRLSLRAVKLSADASQALLSYPWPGNIRELENIIQHALLVMRDNVIQTRDLNLNAYKLFRPGDEAPHQPVVSPDDGMQALDQSLSRIFTARGENLYAKIEERVVRGAFEYCNKNQVHTAQLLGISRNILRHRLKLYDVIS